MLILLFKNVLKISNFEKSAKANKNPKKTFKNSEKSLQIFLCVCTFTWEEKIYIIKIACFMRK